MTTARALLEKFGQVVTWERETPGTYTPSSASCSTGSTTDVTLRVAVLPYHTQEIDGTAITANDRKVYVAPDALPWTPAAGDRLTMADGKTAVVVAVDTFYQAATPQLHVVQARQQIGGA